MTTIGALRERQPSIASSPVESARLETDALRIVHLVITLGAGGAERAAIEITRRLAPRLRTLVCCLEAPGAWADELKQRGVEVVGLHRQPGFHPSLGYRVAAIARRHRATILHCHQYSPFVYGRIAVACNPSLRLVFTEQGRLSDAPPSSKRTFANRFLGRLPGRVYAVCEDLRRYMIAEGFPANRVGTIYNGIEPGVSPTETQRSVARRALGLSETSFVIGTAARLDPVKDLTTLVEAFGQIRLAHPDTDLILIGDGPERARLEQHVRAAGLTERVRFTGYRADVRRLMPALDLYINCSTSEGTSLTILEAMASSLPVVATRVGGNPEVVLDGETGVLVPARAPAALAQAIATLAGTVERRQAMGMAGRSRLEQHFTVQNMVDRYVSVYRELTGP